MISLQSLLSGVALVHKIPLFTAVAFGVILIIAFIVGMVKGFRKVSWGGFHWLLACVGFIFAYKYLYDNNPLDGKLKGDAAVYTGFLWAFALAIGCVLISLLLCGIFAAIFRPKAVWVKDYDRDQYGFEYESDEMDDRTVGEKPSGKKLVWKGRSKPCFFARLTGGLHCALNVATVLAVIGAAFLLIVVRTKLGEGTLGRIFDVKAARIALKYTVSYALDFITVGIVLGIAYGGYKIGFIGSARAFVTTLGILFAVGFGFAVPFVKGLAEIEFFDKLIYRCSKLFTNLNAKAGDILLRDLCTKLTAGFFIAAMGTLVVVLIILLLRFIEKKVDGATGIRVVDGFFSMLIFLVIGAAVSGLFWGILYLLDYCGIFHARELFNEKASLSKEFFLAAEYHLKEFADKVLLKYKG